MRLISGILCQVIGMDFNTEIEVIERELSSLELDNREPSTLYIPMAYILGLGGKRLRPLLALLAYRAYKPSGDLSEVTPAMRAIELFHNFSLLHDDVMDDAPLRRGKPTVYNKWGANTAILSGDGMLIEAYRELQKLPEVKLPESLKLFNDMATAVCEGQQYDMNYEQYRLNELTLQDYVAMIRLKTSYLFCGAVSLGAYLGGAPKEDRDHLWRAVELMGLAFQIKDDYLDLFGKPAFGKKQGGDIIEGKRTWLLLKAHSKDSETLQSVLDIPNEDERIAAAMTLYKSLGVDAEALDEVDRLSQMGVLELSKLSIKESTIKPLKQLFLSLVKREI